MARKKARPSKERRRGSRGLRGLQGPAGPPGQDSQIVVRQLGKVLAHVTQELEDVQRTLGVQFTRIAQLQADLDSFRLALEKALPR